MNNTIFISSSPDDYSTNEVIEWLIKKNGIEINGDIKNCPSSKTVYGNINDDCMLYIVSSEKFQTTWNISKDQIDDCKVCEFRDVCTDCRAYRKNDNINSKPAKCNYNPKLMKYES